MRNEAGRNFGIIGPTPEEIEYFFLQDRNKIKSAEAVLVREGLIPISAKSILGSIFGGLVAKAPFIIPAFVAVGAIGFVARGQLDNSDKPGTDDADPTPQAEEGISNEGRFVDLPFPPDSKMNLQQAWKGFNPKHFAMDIIRGELDASATWTTFPVLAGADGKACANPPSRQGNAVLIDHDFDGETYYEYSGHLLSIEPSIPDCGSGTKDIKMHDIIGQAGSTGVIDDNGQERLDWPHDHWAFFKIVDGKRVDIDVFDIYSTREDYPNINEPRYTNGKFCGPNTILIDCPTEESEQKPEPVKTPNVEQVTVSQWDLWRTPEFEIEFPGDWNVITLDITMFGYDPSIFVLSNEAFPGETLEEYVERLKKEWDESWYEEVLSLKEMTTYKGPEINGNPSIVLEYPLHYTDEYIGEQERRDFIILLDGKAWIFRIEADPGERDKYQLIMEHMMNSFRLLP